MNSSRNLLAELINRGENSLYLPVVDERGNLFGRIHVYLHVLLGTIPSPNPGE